MKAIVLMVRRASSFDELRTRPEQSRRPSLVLRQAQHPERSRRTHHWIEVSGSTYAHHPERKARENHPERVPPKAGRVEGPHGSEKENSAAVLRQAQDGSKDGERSRTIKPWMSARGRSAFGGNHGSFDRRPHNKINKGPRLLSRGVPVLIGIFCFSPFGHTDAAKERTVEFDYQVKLGAIPSGTSQLNIWLPMMPQNDYQRIEEIEIQPKDNSQLTFDKTYGNQILYYSFPASDTPSDIWIHYKVRRREYSNKSKEDTKIQPSLKENPVCLKKFLRADRLATLSPRVRELASKLTGGKVATIEKARAIYDYVFNNVSYDKTIPGWGQGDTERVCLLKAGNCTDFHSLFISLVRASGIPAKFIMGIPLNEKEADEIPGYHCWAEFYDDARGWIPVDISEAWKDKTKYEYFFGALNQNRLELTQGRDIILEPSQKGEPLNYFIYPYIEVDGKEFTDYSVKFQFRNELQKISKRL